MAIIKCKMCGGDLRIEEGTTVCECEYCGTRQTVPSADNEKKLTLFSRAGRLLRGCEFDKAAGVFESIVADSPEEAEAYWGLVLCKYGIEYVDDPATGKKVPTCHRSSFESVLDDPNFEQACENTDAVARRVYRDEARQIEDLRQAILQVSGKEEPYDVFISYKETDENGDRTLDSVIAQDIYKELTNEGYRVFFSRISLEDKLGTEYEPYIFAALNSAKVMLVVGTDYENFDSVWVKNEWSRFLKLIAAGQKKTLIPVFKNMDAYDMPKEFAKLAAQDMGKVGAMQDLVRGVEKIVGKKKPETIKETVVVQQGEGSMKTAAAVKRGYLALEEGEFDAAKEFFNQALTLDAECAEAYLGLALANEQQKNEDAYIQNSCSKKGSKEALEIPPELRRIDKVTAYNYIPNFLSTTELKNIFDFNLKYLSAVKTQAEIAKQEKARFENNRNLNRAFRFAKGETAERLESFKARLFEGLDRNVAIAKEEADAARAAKEKAYAAHLQASEEKAAALHKQAEKKRDAFYQAACEAQAEASSIADYETVQDDFRKLGTYYDAWERVQQCQLSIQQLQEQQRLKKEAEEKAAAEEAERQRILAEKAKKEKRAKQKKIGVIAGVVVAVAIVAVLIVTTVIIPKEQYKAEVAKYGQEFVDSFYALSVGDTFIFGSYEQDNNTSNGKEEVEWLVLAKENGRILVISKYALDCRPYNTEHAHVTWETCSLRKWLNGTFLNTAFSESERILIPSVVVNADKNPDYSTSSGNNTNDQVFLLSVTEASKYFSSDTVRQCQGTNYCYAQGAYKGSNGNCWWWLRSPGQSSYSAANVSYVGAIKSSGQYDRQFGSSYTVSSSVKGSDGAVRPALWIDLVC